MVRGILAAVLAVALLVGAAEVSAEDDPSLISFGAGWWDLLAGDDDQADFRLEYRHGQRFLHIVKPWAGLEVTTAGGFWGGAGLLIDIYLGRRIVLTGSTGVGGFYEGDGKDLGSPIEFRSTIELGYRFDDRSRLSLAFGHLSNAGIGDDNPGAEVLTLYYHLPINTLFD
ncbi:acyloxyacyl hydrolase [Algihabitans albus]|uniref:acyloxyacyl hydrolase n=1 Tax=Algihabitans albus TaxID=2164067 RepID=UPI000E5D54F8|nr:acyloxyacyl hydrolase [Algihabitans albus]